MYCPQALLESHKLETGMSPQYPYNCSVLSSALPRTSAPTTNPATTRHGCKTYVENVKHQDLFVEERLEELFPAPPPPIERAPSPEVNSLVAPEPVASPKSEAPLDVQDQADDTDEEDPPEVPLQEALHSAYQNLEEDTQQFVQALESGTRSLDGLPLSECELHNGHVFYRETRLYVPDQGGPRARVIQECHAALATGHPGRAQTYQIGKQSYWWPRIHHDVAVFCENCHTCRRVKANTGRYSGRLVPLNFPHANGKTYQWISSLTYLPARTCMGKYPCCSRPTIHDASLYPLQQYDCQRRG